MLVDRVDAVSSAVCYAVFETKIQENSVLENPDTRNFLNVGLGNLVARKLLRLQGNKCQGNKLFSWVNKL